MQINNDYLALTPESTTDTDQKKQRRYDKNDLLGDPEDFFNLSVSNTFTRWSNPSTIRYDGYQSNVGFSIVSYNSNTHQYTLNIASNYSGMLTLVPTKPLNLRRVTNNQHPQLAWDANPEPNIQAYWIYRSDDGGPYFKIGSVNGNTHSYTDYGVDYTKPIWEVTIKYKILARNTFGKNSAYSNIVETFGEPNIQFKANSHSEKNMNKPLSYKIQNYPNPFNPTTIIAYQLPKKSHVLLKIYNTLGEEVATLVNGEKEAGYYNVNFNASNLPGGLYLYKLKAGSFTKVGKMMLLK